MAQCFGGGGAFLKISVILILGALWSERNGYSGTSI